MFLGRKIEMTKLTDIARRLIGVTAVVTFAQSPLHAADDYPARPVRMIVAFAPGLSLIHI